MLAQKIVYITKIPDCRVLETSHPRENKCDWLQPTRSLPQTRFIRAADVCQTKTVYPL